MSTSTNNIQTLNNDDYDEIISIKETDIVNKKFSLYNNIIFFDINEYLTKIYESYNCEMNEIDRQFEKDFCRHKIIFNNEKINNMNIYKKKIKDLTNQINFGKYNMSIRNIIIMLMTQSSYYLPFLYLYKRITNKNIHIVNSEKDKIIKMDITNFYFSDNIICFDINMFLNAINTETEIIERSYNITLNLNLNINKLKFDTLGTISID